MDPARDKANNGDILRAFQVQEYKTKQNIAFIATLAIINALLIGYFVYLKNYSASILFFLAGGIIAFLTIKKKSRFIKCKIRKRGVQVNDTLYPYKYLKSFWIFYDPPRQAEISLWSKKALTGYIKIPLGEEDPVKIRKLLIKFIPEKKQEESLSDIFVKIIGL